jgi:hypothetical protein
MLIYLRIFLLFIFLALQIAVVAQQTPLREQMDREREGNFDDIKTYEKARKFIRMDSNYYLGHLLEGAYLFYRANDELGFNEAIIMVYTQPSIVITQTMD